MKNIRKIDFDLKNIDETILKNAGVYKIINKITNDFYIGSCNNFKKRFKDHCSRYDIYKKGLSKNYHPKLWNAYDKYGIENFTIGIIEILNDKSYEEILAREEFFIHSLKPKYNISLYPTVCGKPNLGKKLTDEWKNKIKEKSSQYKHSEETLKKVSENNKKNAVKLKMINENTLEELNFNSWVEAALYFDLKTPSSLKTSYKNKGKWKNWIIEKLSTQTKKIKVYLESEELIFNSYSECDKYFNMWRGYTSELTQKKSKQLIQNKYEFELI
jgi:group I intron endonuclease